MESMPRSSLEEIEAAAWEALLHAPSNKSFTTWAFSHCTVREVALKEMQQETQQEKPAAAPHEIQALVDATLAAASDIDKLGVAQSELFPVIVLRKPINKTVVALMRREDMESFQRYKEALLRCDATFDIHGEHAWEHWTTVRDAWMKTRWGWTSMEKLSKLLKYPTPML